MGDEQLPLFGPDEPEVPAPPPAPRPPTLDERYRAWRDSHACTFELFRQYAWELRHAGRERIGAKAIAERMRWDSYLAEARGDGADAYKIPNQYVSRMVRDMIEADPTWADYFETRQLQS